jgi:hypothetical protein
MVPGCGDEMDFDSGWCPNFFLFNGRLKKWKIMEDYLIIYFYLIFCNFTKHVDSTLFFTILLFFLPLLLKFAYRPWPFPVFNVKIGCVNRLWNLDFPGEFLEKKHSILKLLSN